MEIVRKASSAGSFYPRFKDSVIEIIDKCFLDSNFGPGKEFHNKEIQEAGFKRKNIGAICPHAGYVYSGPAAAMSFQSLFSEKIPDTVILLGTTHTGYRGVGIMTSGKWETPLGKIDVDKEVANVIISKDEIIQEDDSAFNGYPHSREHCIEVQIPFIQYINKKTNTVSKIVPIKIGVFNIETLKKVGKCISDAIKEEKEKGKDIIIVASSDMSHYQPRKPKDPEDEIENTQKKGDNNIIKKIESFEVEDAFNLASNSTVCGPQTIATLLYSCRELGFGKVKSNMYYTSFESAGKKKPCDYSVGYYSATCSK